MNILFVIQTFTKCFQILYEFEYISQEVGHVSNHSKIFLHACIETFLHDWFKWFQTRLMIKIVHNFIIMVNRKVIHLILTENMIKKINYLLFLGPIWP